MLHKYSDPPLSCVVLLALAGIKRSLSGSCHAPTSDDGSNDNDSNGTTTNGVSTMTTSDKGSNTTRATATSNNNHNNTKS